MTCPVCGRDVPAGRFCGACGAPMVRRRFDGPAWLRIRQYCAAPREPVPLPMIVSTVFPLLPRASRGVFRNCLLALLLTMGLFILLHWQVPVIAVATLGFPVLMVVYLTQSGVAREQALGTWLLVVLSGGILGFGYAVLSGALIASHYGLGLGAGVAGGPTNSETLGVPFGAVLGMALPAIVVRLTGRAQGDSLAGFVIGAVGATCFGAAATVVHVSPQFAAGLVAPHRPLLSLLVEAGIRGVAIPLTSAAIGGLVGLALWFRRRPARGGRRRAVVAVLVIVGVVVVVAAAGRGLTDAWPLSQVYQLVAHLAITAAVLLVARICLQLALLHEAHDDDPPGAELACPECALVVPDMPFCPNCGVAHVALAHGRTTSARRLLASFGGGVAAVVAVAVAVCALVTEPVARYVCPPQCGEPPIGVSISVNPRFTASNGAFSVAYPAPGSPFEVSTGPDWLIATPTSGDGGVLRFSGEPAHGRSARQVVRDLLAGAAPNATLAYEIPNAMVGYEVGYGEVADDYPQDASGSARRVRIVALAAVRDDYALIAAAAGPFHQFGPDFGPGPPSPVNLELAMDMDIYVNSFRWRDDPGH